MKQRFSTDLSALVQGVLQQNMVKAVVLRGATLMGGPNKGLNCTKTVSEKAQSSQLVAFFVASCSGSFREIPSLVLSLVIVERRACVCMKQDLQMSVFLMKQIQSCLKLLSASVHS